MQKFIIFLLIIVLILPLMACAKLGVGIAPGIIKSDALLKGGGIYTLPPVTVSNTGDEPADYKMEVTYHSQQTEIRPPQKWFSFHLASFHLEPGQSQEVQIKLTLPVKTQPGDYLGYLEAHPIVKSAYGTTAVGIAVAAKLYFTVVPANIWQGITFRISSFWTRHSPWTWIVLAVIAAGAVIALLRKFFTFQIGVKKQ